MGAARRWPEAEPLIHNKSHTPPHPTITLQGQTIVPGSLKMRSESVGLAAEFEAVMQLIMGCVVLTVKELVIQVAAH